MKYIEGYEGKTENIPQGVAKYYMMERSRLFEKERKEMDH